MATLPRTPPPSATGKPSSARSPIPRACAIPCSASARARITSGRRMTKTTPSGCWRSSRSSASTRRSRPSTFCFRRPKSAWSKCWSRRNSRPSCRSRRWPSIPRRSRPQSSLPTYNAYSKDGDVTGPLVYVNYGVREDYEQLERMGVSVKGAIVIARYGGAWRGIKPKVAAEHGAVGCLIYSDPTRRRLLRRPVFSRWPVPSTGRRAARQRDGHRLSWRSADPGRGRDQRRQAARHHRSQDHHYDSGAAHFLWRRAAAAGGDHRPGRARELARRAAHHLSRGARARRRSTW